MIRRTPRSTRTDQLFPYTTLVRSAEDLAALGIGGAVGAGDTGDQAAPRRDRQVERLMAHDRRDGGGEILRRRGHLEDQTELVARRDGVRLQRTEERRVGKECGSTCRSRG